METEKKQYRWSIIFITIIVIGMIAFIVNGAITGNYVFDINHPFGIGAEKDTLSTVKDTVKVVTDTINTVLPKTIQ